MQSIKNYFLFFLPVLIFSCKTPTDVTYFQNTENLEKITIPSKTTPILREDDIISIFVSAADMDTAMPFNLSKGGSTRLPTEETAGSDNAGSSSAPTYLIDSSGNIEFPVLGELKVSGLYAYQVKNLIKEKLKTYINDPVVTVELTNFKITILGEVGSPGTFTIPNGKISIIEALGLSGDLTIKGKRQNITVIRESDTTKTFYKMDLTSKNVFNSPAYYLAQNDIIYVEPNETRTKESLENKNTLGIILGTIGTVLTIALSIVTLSSQ